MGGKTVIVSSWNVCILFSPVLGYVSKCTLYIFQNALCIYFKMHFVYITKYKFGAAYYALYSRTPIYPVPRFNLYPDLPGLPPFSRIHGFKVG